jgi:FKBP-type peptidyl-prolyl cis-trans isomerase FkpA
MAFRDDLHAARSRAELLAETNRTLSGELHAAYRGRFPRRSFRYSVALTLMSVVGLTALGGLSAWGALTLPRLLHPPVKVAPVDEQPQAIVEQAQQVDDSAQLEVKDLRSGTGPEVKTGDKLRVHYVGTLTDGTEFDSSRKRGEPFTFTFGKGQVIKGWEYGLVGMHVGGLRKLSIPPHLAYGDHAQGKIPASSTIIFEVELLGIVE